MHKLLHLLQFYRKILFFTIVYKNYKNKLVQHKRNALKDKKINVKRWPRKIPNLWLWQIKQLLYFNWHTYSSLRLDGWMRSCYLLNTQHTNLQFSLSKSETYTYSTYGNTRAHTLTHTYTHTTDEKQMRRTMHCYSLHNLCFHITNQ